MADLVVGGICLAAQIVITYAVYKSKGIGWAILAFLISGIIITSQIYNKFRRDK
jgi:hypothetical protein